MLELVNEAVDKGKIGENRHTGGVDTGIDVGD